MRGDSFLTRINQTFDDVKSFSINLQHFFLTVKSLKVNPMFYPERVDQFLVCEQNIELTLKVEFLV